MSYHFKNLVEEGMGEMDDHKFSLTREGLLRVDALLHEFYLEKHHGLRYS